MFSSKSFAELIFLIARGMKISNRSNKPIDIFEWFVWSTGIDFDFIFDE
jgi:hypothetical protein